MPNLIYRFLSSEYYLYVQVFMRLLNGIGIPLHLLILDFCQWENIKFPCNAKLHNKYLPGLLQQPQTLGPTSSPLLPFTSVCVCAYGVCGGGVSAYESLTLQLVCAKWLFLTAHRMPNSTEWVNWHFKKVIVQCNRQGYLQNWEVECRSPTHWILSHLEEQAEDKSTATTLSWFFPFSNCSPPMLSFWM